MPTPAKRETTTLYIRGLDQETATAIKMEALRRRITIAEYLKQVIKAKRPAAGA